MPTAQYTGCAKQDTNYLPDETVERPCDSRRIKGRRITDSPASSRRFANFIALRLFHVYCLTFIAPRLLLHVGRSNIEREHEPVGSLVLERFGPGSVSLIIIWHHDEAIVAGCAP